MPPQLLVLKRSAIGRLPARAKIGPLVHEKPVTMRLERVERGEIPGLSAGNAYLKHVDARTYEVTGKDTREALSRL